MRLTPTAPAQRCVANSDALRRFLKALATIVVATIAAHLVGSIVLFGVVSGPVASVFAPILAVFGWFFIVPEVLACSVQWFAYRPNERARKTLFLVVSAAIAAPGVALLGPKERGSEFRWTLGYAFAAAVAAVVSGLIVQYAKRGPPSDRS